MSPTKETTSQQEGRVEVIESGPLEDDVGSSTMGTVAGAAAGTALAAGAALLATAAAPVTIAAAVLGGVVGAVTGGAMGKEVPRGVAINEAMDFDQPQPVESDTSSEGEPTPEERAKGHIGAHEIADIQGPKRGDARHE